MSEVWELGEEISHQLLSMLLIFQYLLMKYVNILGVHIDDKLQMY